MIIAKWRRGLAWAALALIMAAGAWGGWKITASYRIARQHPIMVPVEQIMANGEYRDAGEETIYRSPLGEVRDIRFHEDVDGSVTHFFQVKLANGKMVHYRLASPFTVRPARSFLPAGARP